MLSSTEIRLILILIFQGTSNNHSPQVRRRHAGRIASRTTTVRLNHHHKKHLLLYHFLPHRPGMCAPFLFLISLRNPTRVRNYADLHGQLFRRRSFSPAFDKAFRLRVSWALFVASLITIGVSVSDMIPILPVSRGVRHAATFFHFLQKFCSGSGWTSKVVGIYFVYGNS
jgi:hypothetical protein